MRLYQTFVSASDWFGSDKYEFVFSKETWFLNYPKLHPTIINKLEE